MRNQSTRDISSFIFIGGTGKQYCNNIDTPLVYLLTDNCNTILLIINCAVNTVLHVSH